MLSSSPSVCKANENIFLKNGKTTIFRLAKNHHWFFQHMLKARKRVTHFEALINAILSFNDSPNFEAQFRNWSTVVNFLENQSTSRQMKFYDIRTIYTKKMYCTKTDR